MKKTENGTIVVTEKVNATLTVDSEHKLYSIYDVKLSDLEELLKQAKKMKKYWTSENRTVPKKIKASFVHLNPRLTFYVHFDG